MNKYKLKMISGDIVVLESPVEYNVLVSIIDNGGWLDIDNSHCVRCSNIEGISKK